MSLVYSRSIEKDHQFTQMFVPNLIRHSTKGQPHENIGGSSSLGHECLNKKAYANPPADTAVHGAVPLAWIKTSQLQRLIIWGNCTELL